MRYSSVAKSDTEDKTSSREAHNQAATEGSKGPKKQLKGENTASVDVDGCESKGFSSSN